MTKRESSSCGLIKLVFEIAHGGLELVAPAKGLNDLDWRADLGERNDLEGVGRFDGLNALVRVFIQQRLHDGTGLLAKPGKIIALADSLGAFLASEGRFVIGDVADQVERVIIATYDFLQRVQRQALLFQLPADGALL